LLSPDSPRVESFVLRFVQDAPESSAPWHALGSENSNFDETRASRRERATWHAVVVHVQSNEEKTFTDFADAVAFIARYVPLGEFVFDATEAGRRKTNEFGHSGE